MKKPTYYLWNKDYTSEEELQQIKQQYQSYGYRVVIFRDGAPEKNIHDGLKAIIRNHYPELL